MPDLIQLVYVSRSTYVPTSASNIINPHIAEILSRARSFNKKNGLFGVLYFGDNYYLQCLEGESATVLALYSKLMKDPRHQDLVIISNQAIDSISFSQWNMKHVPLVPQLKQLLLSHGYENFEPHYFNEELTQRVLVLLYNASGTEHN